MTTSQAVPNSLLEQIKNEHLNLMTLSLSILETTLSGLTFEQVNLVRERPEGWNITEVICHLRDFDEIFRNRTLQILAEESLKLTAYDQNQLAIDNDYASQKLASSFNELSESREKTITLFSSLETDKLLRAGVHPERGQFTILNQMMQIGIHESKHIHQISRILAVEDL